MTLRVKAVPPTVTVLIGRGVECGSQRVVAATTFRNNPKMTLQFRVNGDTIFEDTYFVLPNLGIANMECSCTALKVGHESVVG